MNEVNPVRELRSLTACADGGFRPPSALRGNDHRLKSVAFSNGVNKSQVGKRLYIVTFGWPKVTVTRDGTGAVREVK